LFCAGTTRRRSYSAVQIGGFHHRGGHDLGPAEFSHNPLVRVHHAKIKAKIKLAIGGTRIIFSPVITIMGFARYRAVVYLAPKGLSAPGIGKARIASDFNSVLRRRQNKLGPVRLSVLI